MGEETECSRSRYSIMANVSTFADVTQIRGTRMLHQKTG